jgi:hypothetical protein
MKIDYLPLDAGIELIAPFIFNKPMQWCEDKLGSMVGLPRPDDDLEWDDYDPLPTYAGLAKKLGLPCDPSGHEQPTQVGHVFPLLFRSYSLDCETEIYVNRGMYELWVARAEELIDTLPPEESLLQLQAMSLKMVHYFGCSSRHQRDLKSRDVIEWVTWLRCTHGGYDSSGNLTDDGKEVSTMRDIEINGAAA